MLMDRIWALAHMPQITGALIPWDLIMKDKIYIKKKESGWNLMVSMIDVCFKRRRPGPTLLFLSDQPCHPPRHLHPHSFMWIKACRLFNSSFKRRGDQGEASGRQEGLAGCLCCAVAGRPLWDSARLRCGETRQGLPSGLMPCNED